MTVNRSNNLSSKIEKGIDQHEKIVLFFAVLAGAFVLAVPQFFAYPLRVSTDEMGALACAAKLAGCDWDGVIQLCDYYGFGFYFIFFFLFKFQLSPIVLYRCVLVITRFARVGVILPVTYHMGKRYFGFSSSLVRLLSSFFCIFSFHVYNESNVINDVIVEAVYWLILLFMCKMIEYMDDTKKFSVYTIFYLVSCFYILTLHTRGLVPVIATTLVLLTVMIFRKRWRFLSVLLNIPLYYLAQSLISVYTRWMWGKNMRELGNTSVKISEKINLANPVTWDIWSKILIGHLGTQTMVTGGLFTAAVVGIIYYLVCLARKKTDGESIFVHAMIAVSVLCVGAVFLAFLVSNWMKGLYKTWNTDLMGTTYSYKGITYVRYWNIFAMPIMYSGVYLLYKLRERKKLIFEILAVQGIIMLLFATLVVPVVKFNNPAMAALFSFLWSSTEGNLGMYFYYKCILLTAATIFLAMITARMGKEKYILVIFLLFYAVGYMNVNLFYVRNIQINQKRDVMASYREKCLLEEKEVFIDKIYYVTVDDDSAAKRRGCSLQFYFYEYPVLYAYPAAIGENDIIISRECNPRLEQEFSGLRRYELDDNEIWYTMKDLDGLK